MNQPATDADVPAWTARLGLPGLVDLHVHAMPDNVLAKVWAFFDRLPAGAGGPWPIAYREDDAARTARLNDLGVLAHSALSYPHRPGMAEWLNDWSFAYAADHPRVIPSATFFPEPGAEAYVAEALDRGARVFKAHVQVGAYDPRDPLLAEVWRRLAAAGVPVVVHCGDGPHRGRFTGAAVFAEVLAEHPELVAVVAHLGLPEYADFLDLAAAYPRVHLDTTMAFTDFTERRWPFPPALRERLLVLQDRIVLGTDFPNIPYAYAHQLAALERLGLGDDWLRAVCWHNGRRVVGITSGPVGSGPSVT